MTMSPPLPPSPPEGPPRGTNFSRRKAMQPLPPSPALTRILASSMNMGKVFDQTKKPRPEGEAAWRGRPRPRCSGTFDCLLDFHRLDHHELAHRSLVQELDAPSDLGEERIVLAAADVQPGL